MEEVWVDPYEADTHYSLSLHQGNLLRCFRLSDPSVTVQFCQGHNRIRQGIHIGQSPERRRTDCLVVESIVGRFESVPCTGVDEDQGLP